MTIYRLLENTAFGPEDIERLVTAYGQTLRALGLKDRDDALTQLVAAKIIAVGRLGIEDSARMQRTGDLAELRHHGHNPRQICHWPRRSRVGTQRAGGVSDLLT